VIIPRALRRGSLLVGLAIMGTLVAIWYVAAPLLLANADLSLYSQHFKLRGPRPGNPQVAVVAIDEKSLAALGRWPWPRAVLAEIVRRLSDAGAATIAFDIILTEPQKSGELEVATRIAERLRAQGAGGTVTRELERIIADADHDRRLATAIEASGRAILAVQFTLRPDAPAEPPARQGQPLKSAFVSFRNYPERGLYPPPSAEGAGFPIPPLLAAAQSLGHVNMLADDDGVTRWEALVVEHRGHYYPSLALEAVRVAAGIDKFEERLAFGRAVELGGIAVPIDARARVLVDYAGPPGTFEHLSAVDVLRGRVPPEKIKDRIIFIGATAEGTYDLRVTPFSPVFPGVEKHANVAGNLIEGRFIVRPVWVEFVELAGILVLPLLLAWGLPRFRPVASLVVALGVGLVLFGAVHAAFRHGLWLPIVYPSLAIALTFVGITVYRFLTEERQRLYTKRAFQQYVSPEVVEQIVAEGATLTFGGEIRTVTVLFSDLRDFTGYTERHDPQDVVQTLREHFTRMTDCILAERGTLDKYIGDGIMAIFGAPVALPDHAERACRAALTMVAAVEQMGQKQAAEGREPFRIGIGINTGEAVVGNLGSEQLFDYTVVGDVVNLGARLESLNKEYKTSRPIIISDATYEAARGVVEVRHLGEVTVRGKSRPVVVYELVGLQPSAGEPPD
jgi:adenylate cyclase